MKDRFVLHIETDHLPLIYAKSSNFGGQTGRRLRQLQFISEYTTDIRYVKGEHNEVVNCLSRPPDINAIFQNWKTVDLTEIAIAQASDNNLTALIQNSPANLNCVQMKVHKSNSLIWVDISTGAARVLVPECMHTRVFDQIHNLSHPGGKASVDLIKDHFYWENMKRDI